MRLLLRTAALVTLSAALSLYSARAAYPQQPEIEALAAKLRKTLLEAHATKIVVFDLAGPGKEVSQLGQSLADQISAALASKENDFSIVDRKALRLLMEKEQLGLIDGWNDQSLAAARWIASKAGASAIVIGTIEHPAGELRLKVDSYEVSTAKHIDGFEEKITTTPDLERSSETKVALSPGDVPLAGTNGYGIPKCVSCLPPDGAQAKVRPKYSGTVLLMVQITAEGNATDLRVIKDIGKGFTQKTIKAVSKWRFVPANGPDGKPAAVQILAEVTFSYY